MRVREVIEILQARIPPDERRPHIGPRTWRELDYLATLRPDEEWPPGAVAQPTPGRIPVSAEGIALIQHFESCLKPIGDGRFTAYPDPAHGWAVPTIGWGTVQYEDGRKVKQGDVITQRRADELLAWEMTEKAAAVDRLVKVPLNPDERAALVSFAYNVGIGNLEKSTLLKRLNENRRDIAADEFLKWDKAGGQTLRGLTRRRKSERNLFLGKHQFIAED